MEEERKIKENTGNMLKQALERRQTEQPVFQFFVSDDGAYSSGSREADETENEHRVGGFAGIRSGVGGTWYLRTYFLSRLQFCRYYAENESPAGFFFVCILCIYCFVGVGLARVRLLAA
mgnify:CR=1 FL=1